MALPSRNSFHNPSGLNSSAIQSSHESLVPPHGAAPYPTDYPHTYPAVPGSIHTPESVPSSPPFFYMNPQTDQHLTGSLMPYQPVDHHPLTRYAYIHTLSDATVTVDNSHSCHTPSQHIDLLKWPRSSWSVTNCSSNGRKYRCPRLLLFVMLSYQIQRSASLAYHGTPEHIAPGCMHHLFRSLCVLF